MFRACAQIVEDATSDDAVDQGIRGCYAAYHEMVGDAEFAQALLQGVTEFAEEGRQIQSAGPRPPMVFEYGELAPDTRLNLEVYRDCPVIVRYQNLDLHIRAVPLDPTKHLGYNLPPEGHVMVLWDQDTAGHSVVLAWAAVANGTVVRVHKADKEFDGRIVRPVWGYDEPVYVIEAL